MRIYISGPITGTSDYKERFARAEEELTDKGHSVINPAKIEETLPGMTYEEYLKIDLALLDMCDAIYMLEGWKNSCGANREHGYALAMGITIVEED